MGTTSSFNSHGAARESAKDDGNWSLEGVLVRARKAMRRDWDQTMYDLNFEGGFELNQDCADTIQQILGQQRIPRGERPNPQKLAGDPGNPRRHGAVWPRGVI